jgi:predicted hydrocarbon binding protein
MGDSGRYFVPDQWGHLLMEEAQKMLSSMEYGSLQKLMTPSGQMPGSIPSNMKKQFPFEMVSATHKFIWNALGDGGAREVGLRVGHRMIETSLSQFRSVAAAAQVAMKVGSTNAKLKIAMEFFSKFFNAVSDEVIVFTPDAGGGTWMVTRCASCWHEPSDSAVCFVQVGMVQGILRWTQTDTQFQVSEEQCIAMGARHCAIRINRGY